MPPPPRDQGRLDAAQIESARAGAGAGPLSRCTICDGSSL